MRIRLFSVFVIASLLSPIAVSHTSNDVPVILRGYSIQAGQHDLLHNDSVTFYNMADVNRTIRVDLDGDGIYDQRCETAPSNSSSIRNQCSFIIDQDVWGKGDYILDIFSNGEFWKALNMTVSHDLHFEEAKPGNYSFNLDEKAVEQGERGLQDFLRNIAIVLLGIFWIARRSRYE